MCHSQTMGFITVGQGLEIGSMDIPYDSSIGGLASQLAIVPQKISNKSENIKSYCTATTLPTGDFDDHVENAVVLIGKQGDVVE